LALFCGCAGYVTTERTTEGPKWRLDCPDRTLADYFRAETEKLAGACLSDIETLEDWKARRPIYRKQLFEMLGLEPLPPRTDLKPVITGTIDHNEFTVENIHFQSRPGLYVTGNLYIPKDLDAPAPTILYACGHGRVKKDGISYGNKAVYQHHGAWFARNGYVCFVIDTLQLGEIEGIHHGTYRHKMWWWNCRGYNPAGVEAWNCIRALDYLQTRPEVDGERFGVTGRSGGGAYSWWLTTLDDRIKVTVPVAGITDLQNHVVDGCVEGHCDCMYLVNTYRWDYALVAALVAPRPLLISNSDKDHIFPLDGVIRLHEKVRRIYRLYNAEDKLGLHITEGPHKDRQELRVHAFVWFNRFLKNERDLIETTAVKFFEPEQLKVFDKLPADQINTKIQESFTPKALQPGKMGNKLSILREKSFNGWPCDTEAGPLDITLAFRQERNGIVISAYDFTSQPYVALRLYLLHKAGLTKPKKLVLTVPDQQQWDCWLSAVRVVFADEFEEPNLPEPNDIAFDRLSRKVLAGDEVLAYLPPRGIGPTAWRGNEFKHTQIRRRFMLLGQTLDGMRVWDVHRAIQALRNIDSVGKVALWLSGRERMAGIALYASLFEPDVAGLYLRNLPKSHRDGPFLLNVLRYLDIPQALEIATHRQIRIHQKECERDIPDGTVTN
jgi:dienelactone hydrolase